MVNAEVMPLLEMMVMIRRYGHAQRATTGVVNGIQRMKVIMMRNRDWALKILAMHGAGLISDAELWVWVG